MQNKYYYTILRFFFSFLLIATAVGKLLDNRGFSNVILSYQFGLTANIALSLGLFVSLFELFLGLSIGIQFKQKVNAILISLMHLGYVLLAVSSLYRGLELQNCGCFGVFLKRPLTQATVVEDLVLLALSISFYFQSRNKT